MGQVEEAIAEAKEMEGDTEVREGLMAKAQILARSGDKESAVEAYDVAFNLPKTTSGACRQTALRFCCCLVCLVV